MQGNSCCHHNHDEKKKIDYLLWGSLSLIAIFYSTYLLFSSQISSINWLSTLSSSIFHISNTVWWGILAGVIAAGILSKVPREFVMSVLGKGGTIKGLARATLAGVLLDLCSHGILIVGMKLYERGASIGQIMAFLIASPWNSFSLTLILTALIGIKWTLAFIILSMIIALITGYIFDIMVSKGKLPENPNKSDLPEDFSFFPAAKKGLLSTKYDFKFFIEIIISGFKDSKMVLRWLLLGIILASMVRAFIPTEHFQSFFGPSILGLTITLIAATLIEVCSEGSTPIAADILTRAGAPGNSFAFLMTGVATDYTEIMSIKETTRSWKIALALPMITVPQVFFVAWIINNFAK